MPKGSPTAVAMPEKLLKEDVDRLIARKNCERAMVGVKGFKVSALLFPKRKRLPMKSITYFEGRINNQLVHLASVKDPKLVKMSVATPKDSEHKDKWPLAKKAYQKILEDMAAITGRCKFVFHCDGKYVRDPYPDRLDIYHIFPSASPTGETDTRYIGRVFDIPIGDPELKYLCPKAVPGRGDVLTDDFNPEPIIQIVGNNIYLLFSCIESYCYSSEVIFWMAIARAWNFIKHERKEKAKLLPPKDDFKNTVRIWLDRPLESLNEHLKEKQEKINKLQKGLNMELGNLTFLLSVRETVSISSEKTKIDHDSEYQKIISNPRLNRVLIVDDGIMAVTNPVVADHEDKKYKLGIYGIRVNKFGALSIWCEKSEHPKNIPHPHIQRGGAVCFGNASRTIEQAAAEFRIYDAFNSVLEWLEYGYAPEYAQNKIREWPCL